MKSLSATAFLAILFFVTCTKEAHLYTPANHGCDSGILSYKSDIKLIIQTNCSGSTCHQPGTGNYDFSNYEVLANNIRSWKFEYRLLLPKTDPQHMPQSGPPNPITVNYSDSCDLYKILAWIKQGYPNN